MVGCWYGCTPKRGRRQLDVEQLFRIVLAALQLRDDDRPLGLAVVGLVETRVHALGFDEEHAIERVARRRFEIGGLVNPGVAVPRAAELLDDALHLVPRDVAGALEVHVLDPVRHAGQARPVRLSSRPCTSTRPRRAARCGPPARARGARCRGRFRARPAWSVPGATRTYGHYYNRQTVMPEWKDTCNLPRTAFSMKANLQTAEPEAHRPLGTDGPVRPAPPCAGRRTDVPPARRPAVRQRRNPHRHRPQQGAEGSRGQVPQHGRLRRALRAGLGLPRPANRAEGRPPARPEETRRCQWPTSAATARRTRRSTSASCARTSNGWACSARGTSPT